MTSNDPRLLALLDEPVTGALRSAAGETPCHLVGGLLRDRLLGVAGSDFDAVVGGDGQRIAERLARRLPARLVHLGGKAFAAYRLAGAGFTLDLWDRRRQSLEADLGRRDFTVNAFALGVADGRLIDPFDGLSDLARRRLRATTAGVFVDDPLRVLRLVRFTGQLPGFRAEPGTVELARRSSAAIAAVAAERVREELARLLRGADMMPGLDLLAELELYPGLLRGSPGEPGDATRGRRLLARVEAALHHLSGLPQLPHGRLAPADPRLAALFAGLGTTAAAQGALEGCRRAGYLTGQAAARCRRLLDCRRPPESTAARRWFLHSWGKQWPAALIALAALAEPAPGDADWQRLVARLGELAARHAAEIFTPRPLLDGDEIGRLLDVPPGPRVGAAVALLRRAQVEGRVLDRAAAEALLRSASGAG